MTKPVAFRQTARDDVEAATEYYQLQGGIELALNFTDAFQQALRGVADSPAMGSPRLGQDIRIDGLRSRRVRRFPFLILYVEHAEQVEVVRVLHERRDIAGVLEAES